MDLITTHFICGCSISTEDRNHTTDVVDVNVCHKHTKSTRIQGFLFRLANEITNLGIEEHDPSEKVNSLTASKSK